MSNLNILTKGGKALSDKIKLEILIALNSEIPKDKVTQYHQVESKYNESEFYSALEDLMNGNYIINLPVDIAADGSKMFSIMATTGVTTKGLSFIQSHKN
jgi:hypothetical protein